MTLAPAEMALETKSQQWHSLQREPATFPLCQELFPLLELHYQEISGDLDIPLNPDFEKYVKLEEMGMLRVFTARTCEAELIGYAIYFVHPNFHYSSSLQANQDVLFIHPKHRGSGGRLIKFADRELAHDGVQKVYHHVKVKHNFGPLLERLGYRHIEHIYAKRLDKPSERRA